MNILLIHQNFPGQFKYLAPALAADTTNRVLALTMQEREVGQNKGVYMVRYGAQRSSSVSIHPWVSDFETKIIRAEACFKAALTLRDDGFMPDVIVAHPGWGESLFLKDVWPKARLGIYCEYYYHAEGADVGFDKEFSKIDPGQPCRLKLKNINNLMHFDQADAGLAPTRWQASTFPEPFRNKITVVHDGVDTNAMVPAPQVSMMLNGQTVLSRKDEIITFVNRNLEPYRGYHIFMRALPDLLKRRPNARVLIVGGDGVSYGAGPEGGKSWKDVFASEVRPQISDMDWKRVHFLGNLSHPHFTALLQISTVHVYLTYPFVLSWSLLEAMSVGCAIVASDTQPVREAIQHDVTGRLVDFFDVEGLSAEVCRLMDDPQQRARLGANARAFATKNYDLANVCLPGQMAWVQSLITAE